MVVVTPGIDLLARGFFLLSAFVAVIVSLNSLVATRLGYVIPTWIVLLSTALGIPLLSSVYILALKFRTARQAAAMGARVVPEVQGKMLGNLDVLKEMMDNFRNGYPGDGLDELIAAKGPVINMRVLWSDMLVTTSPEHIKTILATDFPNYVKGERFHYNMGAVLGTGVFNSDGEMWKFHRSITRPMFTRERISHFELFDRKAALVVSKIRERLREGYAFDFQDIMSRFTLDSATEFLFGRSVESLSAGLPYPPNASHVPQIRHTARGDAANEFATAFLQAQIVISMRERYGWAWPLAEMFKDESYQPMQVVNAYIEPIVKEALIRKKSLPPKEKGSEEEYETLLDHLVSVTDDPTVLKDEILNIMIAGRDTTAATLTFIIYFLSIYPDVLARLREEIISKVGHTRRPDYDDVKEMKYLRAVINETLRLYPIVPFNVRESINATTWVPDDPTQKPYFIPAGTKTAYSVFMMHRREDLWGPDAEEFDPDRFLDDRLKKYLSKNPFIFLPFNAGPRICLGQQSFPFG
ncbi:hypothetical protein D9613_002331 [Agrocybe pediades]|uniref:Cytochrome P450 n=1 Tax=Agrocybe pediades TaxID=84607 RepID=A0A8H4VUP6_9AGAR|nr:hypothetical protein D9613_002331 [Agrocybe pediades]